jgi:hypothetical protein
MRHHDAMTPAELGCIACHHDELAKTPGAAVIATLAHLASARVDLRTMLLGLCEKHRPVLILATEAFIAGHALIDPTPN